MKPLEPSAINHLSSEVLSTKEDQPSTNMKLPEPSTINHLSSEVLLTKEDQSPTSMQLCAFTHLAFLINYIIGHRPANLSLSEVRAAARDGRLIPLLATRSAFSRHNAKSR